MSSVVAPFFSSSRTPKAPVSWVSSEPSKMASPSSSRSSDPSTNIYALGMAVQGLDMALMPKRPEQPRVPRYNRKAAESQSTLVAESVDEQPLKETDSAGNDGKSTSGSKMFKKLFRKSST